MQAGAGNYCAARCMHQDMHSYPPQTAPESLQLHPQCRRSSPRSLILLTLRGSIPGRGAPHKVGMMLRLYCRCNSRLPDRGGEDARGEAHVAQPHEVLLAFSCRAEAFQRVASCMRLPDGPAQLELLCADLQCSSAVCLTNVRAQDHQVPRAMKSAQHVRAFSRFTKALRWRVWLKGNTELLHSPPAAESLSRKLMSK